MTLSRDELAARCLTSLLTRDGYTATSAAEVAVVAADALLHALKPAEVAPVAPPAGKYEPRVGDVVRFKDSTSLWVVDGKRPSNPHFTVGITDTVHWSRGCCNPDELTYVRPSTDAEKRAAGLAVPPPAPTPAPEVCCASPLCPHSSPGGGTSQVGGAAERDAGIVTPASPTPAPEAKRPTHVRVTGPATAAYVVNGYLTIGRVYEVMAWLPDGAPRVIGDRGWAVAMSRPDGSGDAVSPRWEPAPCPPPVAGSAEDASVRDAETRVIAAAIAWNAKYNSDEVKYPEGAHSERLDLNDAVAALAEARAALSRPVRP